MNHSNPVAQAWAGGMIQAVFVGIQSGIRTGKVLLQVDHDSKGDGKTAILSQVRKV